MGRPRSFDIDEALRIAADMFWRRGYDGTSIGDLTKAIGVSAPSFYFAFGSKEGLFEKIVEEYQKLQTPLFDEALGQSSVDAVIRHLLFGYVDLLTVRGRAPGCLIMNSSLPVTDDHPFSRRFADERKALKERLRKRFSRLLADAGDDAPDPAAAAQLVVALIWGLAVEAQSGASRASLRASVSALRIGEPESPPKSRTSDK